MNKSPKDFKGLSYLSVACLLCICISVEGYYDTNYALSFDGIDDVVIIGHLATDFNLLTSWTLEAWIKPSGENTVFQPNIVGFPGRHPNLELCGSSPTCNQTGGVITQLREANGTYYTITGAPKVTENHWYHVAGSWDNTTLSLYVDGELDAFQNPYEQGYSKGMVCIYPLCEEGMQIGGFRCCQRVSSQYFRGLIDEVRVWTVGRSQKDIQESMHTTLSGGEAGLLYYWRFDEAAKSLVVSLADDAYGTLGGGVESAEPKWVRSDAPITLSDPKSSTTANDSRYKVIQTSPAVIGVGAAIVVVSLIIGIFIGICVGSKFAKRHSKKKGWEMESLVFNR